MAANNDPIYSKRGAITRSVHLTTAANDYFGKSPYNKEVFAADQTNGSYLQRLRFKAVGTNVTTVARIYLNDGDHQEDFGSAIGAPTGTPSASGGTIQSGTYYALILGVDEKGRMTPTGSISSGVVVYGPTGSIAWSWAPQAGAVSYRIYVGNVNAAAALNRYFVSATNSYSQTSMYINGAYDDPAVGNNKLYGEVSLPAITASAAAATPDVDYMMNFPLPPGWKVYVGLGNTVASGWMVVPIGGDY